MKGDAPRSTRRPPHHPRPPQRTARYAVRGWGLWGDVWISDADAPAFAAHAGLHPDRTRDAPRPGVAAMVPSHAAWPPCRWRLKVAPTCAPRRLDQARVHARG